MMTHTQRHTRMRKVLHSLIACFLILLCVSQAEAVTYSSPYSGKNKKHVSGLYSTAEAAKEAAQMPTMGFQSTSGMLSASSGSSTSSVLLNQDGSIALGAYLTTGEPSGPRKAGTNGPGTPDPEDPGTNDNQQIYTPIGDAAWPLLLMVMVFGGTLYFRRRKLTH